MDYFKKAKRAVNEAREIASTVHNEYKQFQGRNDSSYNQGGYQSSPQHNHYQQQPPTAQYYPPQQDARQAFNMASMANTLPPQPHHFPSSKPSAAPVKQPRGCPGDQAVPVDLVQFYVFEQRCLDTLKPANVPEDQFGICSACYNTLVAPHSRIASAFKPLCPAPVHPDGPRERQITFSCDLALPATRTLLASECVPKQTAEPLLRFAAASMEWFNCAGQVITTPTGYYACRGVEDMGVCTWCFERNIRGTAFEREFQRSGPMSEGVSWLCDFGGHGYIYKAMMQELGGSEARPSFARFVGKANKRMRLPPCPGPSDTFPPPGNGQRVFVYEAVEGKSGVFCQGCYWDRILGTSMERYFNVYNELGDEFRGQIGCDLTGIASQFAMDVAIKRNDDEAWRRCMEGRNRYPQCVGVEGVDEEDLLSRDRELNRWYHLRDHPNIEICSWCYYTTVEVYGATSLFAPINRTLRPGVVRMCFLSVSENLNADTSDLANFENTLVWRGSILRNWLQGGYDKNGDFSAFRVAAAKIAARPPPCSSGKRAFKPTAGRKWYGNHFLSAGDVYKTGITVCEECFDYCIRGTSIEWFAGVDQTEKTYAKAPDGFCCNSSTRRQRRELRQAAQHGVFNEYADYLARRREIEARWDKVNDLCNEQAERQLIQKQQSDMATGMAGIQHMQAMNASMNATIMRIGGSVAEAAATDYGQRYGNSAVGYGYLTPNGASAALASLDAEKLVRQSKQISTWHPTGDVWSDTQILLALSRVIQAEWEAIQ
ncbi:hypothetical protein GGR51DRAFT_503689 [Nemania sp. FL0031]|nr:hypothetical protein GGR51DRAFT_503689 [Nemania sp. FL0031]